jgi:translation initiation factor 4A
MSDLNEIITEQPKNLTFSSWDDDNVCLNKKLLRGIFSYGFDKPSPIQQKAIIPMINKKDIIAQAQSGTGKTGAFTVGLLQSINEKEKTSQVIVLSPTRELALQNFNVCNSLSTNMKVTTQLLIGGTSTDTDKELLLTNTPHVIVGCPGRIQDMLRRGHIKTDNINMLVLDEADELLSSGFKEQIYNIFQFMNNDIQVCLFSATMPPELYTLTAKFMRDPIKILVNSDMLTLDGISQYKICLENDQQKYATLKDIFSSIAITQCIIYCNSVKRVQDLTDAMKQDGYPVACIHSNMTVEERKTSFLEFKSGKNRVLISSDVTARGIDVQQVSIVINFDVPNNKHTYIHRIGRSGRWGRKGMGINFVTRRDVMKIKEIVEWYSTQIEDLPTNFVDKIRS